MTRIIVLLAIVIAVAIIIQQLKNTPKERLKQQYWKLGLIAAAIVLIVLALTGRIHWLGALFGALLPLVRKSLPLLMGFLPKIKKHFAKDKSKTTTENDQTTITTALLKITIDHHSQQLQGNIIDGPFAGQTLSALTFSQLQALLEYCQQHDQQACPLLARFIDQRFSERGQQSGGTTNNADLSVAEAYQILGLAPGDSKDSIIRAHKKLIQKLHPDRGGNDYLAAKINRAKDILLAQVN